jgi:flavin reductase (DIM6/NTAB) family NADH-FMN oxidoreductase RutF
MKKVKMGAKPLIYPVPVILLGANVKGKPNYNTLGNFGSMSISPVVIYVSSAKRNYTNKGILQNQSFSVNTPSVELVEATDYCGIVSGWKVDKSEIFESFYGKLGTAPMIMECPVNLECKLVKNFDVHPYEVFVGKVMETYVSEQYLTDVDSRHKLPDMDKINPIILSPDLKY